MIEHKEYPYKFDENKCSSCEGNCCIGESGYIWITKDECEKLSSHLGITIDELGMNYLLKVGYKYSIKERQIYMGTLCVLSLLFFFVNFRFYYTKILLISHI